MALLSDFFIRFLLGNRLVRESCLVAYVLNNCFQCSKNDLVELFSF